MDTLTAFLDSQAGLALKGALVAAGIDFLTGSFAALKDGTFALDALAAFLRKHILGRVAPLAALLAGSYLTGDAILMTFAVGGLTAYAAETIASVKGNLVPPKESDIKASTTFTMDADRTGVTIAEPMNPVPQD